MHETPHPHNDRPGTPPPDRPPRPPPTPLLVYADRVNGRTKYLALLCAQGRGAPDLAQTLARTKNELTSLVAQLEQDVARFHMRIVEQFARLRAQGLAVGAPPQKPAPSRPRADSAGCGDADQARAAASQARSKASALETLHQQYADLSRAAPTEQAVCDYFAHTLARHQAVLAALNARLIDATQPCRAPPPRHRAAGA